MLSNKHSVDADIKSFGHFCSPLCCEMNSTGIKPQGPGKGLGQGAERITLQHGGSQQCNPSALCTVWSIRCGKARIYCQQPVRGPSYRYTLSISETVRQGKNNWTDCITTFTWGLENSIHPVLQSSTLFALNVLLGCAKLVLSCGADPDMLLLALSELACNQSWLVLRWQGGEIGPPRSPTVPMWAEQGDFPLTGYHPFTFYHHSASRQLADTGVLPSAPAATYPRKGGWERGRRE